MRAVYPAVFAPEDGDFSVVFPDLPGCSTFGDTLPEALEMARDALTMWLCDAEDSAESIPCASSLASIRCEGSHSLASLVDADTVKYRQQNDNRAVKKTLTIPSWLNAQAERAGVNFSQVLQAALMSRLGDSVKQAHSLRSRDGRRKARQRGG